MRYRERAVVICATCATTGEGWECYHGGPALRLGAYTLLPPDWAWDGGGTRCPVCTSAHAEVVMVDEVDATEVDPDVTTADVG